MKNFKSVKYLPLLFLLFSFNSNASVLDSNSVVNMKSSDKIGWGHSFHSWSARGDSHSVYSPDAISIIDSITPAERSIHSLINNPPSHSLTTFLLVDMVVQLSIDIFLQYGLGMSDYKNLLTGIDATFVSNNVGLPNNSGQSNLAYSSLGIENIDSEGVSVVPVPNAIWLFVTGFMAIIWYRKKT